MRGAHRTGAALALAAAAALSVAISATAGQRTTAAPEHFSRSAIWRENQRPGSWRWLDPAARDGAIDGYGSELSVVAGGTLALHVRTLPPVGYRVAVYRLGWYQGAGARLVTCEPSCPNQRRGAIHRGRAFRRLAIDATTGEVTARWPVTDRIRTRKDWVSGEYLAQLVIASGRNRGHARWVPFVVRSPRPNPDSILAEVPVNTWEAYNSWGGKSLYAYNSSGHTPAVKVSFDRPWAYGDDNLTFPVGYEYRLIQFMERTGLPLEYATDIDVDARPELLLAHRLSVTLGHDEYWSGQIRTAWDRARDAGRNLAFLGADTGYWQARYEDSHRTLVEYRSRTLDPDPAESQKTVQFRFLHPARPECQLEGVQFQSGGIYPPLINSYTVVAGGNPWLDAGGLRPGDVLHNAVRREWDSVVPGCVEPDPTILFRYAGTYPADATLLHTPAGGRVLALGSLGFGALLDGFHKRHCSVDPRAERFLRAALADLAALRPGLLPTMPPACVRAPKRASKPIH